jgi:hypothetical protein
MTKATTAAIARAAAAITPAIFAWYGREKQAGTTSLDLQAALNETLGAAIAGFVANMRQPDSCEPEVCLDEHLVQIRAAALRIMQEG